jgi:hypothetical protein
VYCVVLCIISSLLHCIYCRIYATYIALWWWFPALNKCNTVYCSMYIILHIYTSRLLLSTHLLLVLHIHHTTFLLLYIFSHTLLIYCYCLLLLSIHILLYILYCMYCRIHIYGVCIMELFVSMSYATKLVMVRSMLISRMQLVRDGITCDMRWGIYYVLLRWLEAE